MHYVCLHTEISTFILDSLLSGKIMHGVPVQLWSAFEPLHTKELAL